MHHKCKLSHAGDCVLEEFITHVAIGHTIYLVVSLCIQNTISSAPAPHTNTVNFFSISSRQVGMDVSDAYTVYTVLAYAAY